MPQENHDANRGLSLRDRKAQDGDNEWVQGYNHLLAIGISRYAHFKNLPNAVNDVKKVVELLSRRYHYVVHRQDILLDEQATLGNIHKALRSLQGKVKNTDNLLIYFSGHGFYDEQLEEGFWIPYDGQVDRMDTYLDNARIIKLLRPIRSRHTLLVADSCFSGAFFEARNVQVHRRLMTVPSRWALTSGRITPVPDGPPGKNSPFAESFLFHLEHNQKPHLGITSLYPLVLESVGSNSDQLPRCEPVRIPGHKGGEFFFSLEKEGVVSPDPRQGPPARDGASGSKKRIWWAAAAVAFALSLAVWQVAVGNKNSKPDDTTENKVLVENRPDTSIAADVAGPIEEPELPPVSSFPVEKPPIPAELPKKASLVLSSLTKPAGVIDLGVLKPGEEKFFSVKVKNKGEGRAENISWTILCDSVFPLGQQPFTLRPAEEKTLQFQIRASNTSGEIHGQMLMTGDNLNSQVNSIEIIGKVEEGSPPVISWRGMARQDSITVSFLFEGKLYQSKYDSSGALVIEVPNTINNERVLATFVNKRNGVTKTIYITVRLKENIPIPNLEKPNSK